MAGEQQIEESKPVAPGLKSDSTSKLVDKDMAPKKDGKASDPLASAGNATSAIKGEINQMPGAEQDLCYAPNSCYSYYYPGYNGSFSQLDSQTYYSGGDGSYNGLGDNGSPLYYMPGYNPYTAVSYGSETTPYYSWGSAYNGEVANGNVTKSGNVKSAMGQNGSHKANGFNHSKTNGNLPSKAATLPLNSKARQFDGSSNYSKSIQQTQSLKPLNKLGSGYQSMGLEKGFHPVGKYSSFANQNHGVFMHYAPVNYQTNVGLYNRSRGNFSRNGEFVGSDELKRGPRGNTGITPSDTAESEQAVVSIEKEKFKVEDFSCKYDNAKFYVIKSYSEDDIHKCIKYDVWSSTRNGNKKLDAAFRDADAKSSESGAKCPVFLFFSVNGSGQFLGVAEMIGQVDFNKSMDFWQLDKWSGFFPVKWHIVKDVPNSQLRHIILENNDNRSVTCTRDTQEIGLKQGLEMLSIFKSYTEKTSILDDFNFYEGREKSLKSKRSYKPASQTDRSKSTDATRPINAGGKTVTEDSTKTDVSDPVSLIGLTENLSLNS
ncbi:RNA metabolism protein [Lithospermum erythrorhizon]|uniref:YTH domain-containing family protein n=1 Tax=Lithospermum erythrorhizon TaxID=34254 RepID=A0AAV3Q8V9_LITER